MVQSISVGCRHRLRRACWTWLAIGFAVCLSGCGAETYKARLAETVQYFEYQDRINRDLGREWAAWGIVFRPPRQCQLIPPPAPPAAEGNDGAVTDVPEADPRQPHFLRLELPGLLAAWEANIRTDSSEPGQKAYLYLLSNHTRYLGEDGEAPEGDPVAFLGDVELTLTAALGVFLPEGTTGTGREKNVRYNETAPRGAPNANFAPRKSFVAVTLAPAEGVLDQSIEIQLYEWSGQRIQVAIVMVYPKNISPSEDLQQRLLLALETFEASDERPRASRGARGSPAGPGRPGSF